MTGAVAQWLAHARNQVKVAIMLWVELQVKALCVSTLVDPTVFIKPLCVQHAQRLLHTLKVPFSPFGKARQDTTGRAETQAMKNMGFVELFVPPLKVRVCQFLSYL